MSTEHEDAFRPRRENILPTEEEVEEEANSPAPWPNSMYRVAKCETPKFIRMATMFCLIALIYSVLRDTKDAVVMERQEPASIPFLKMGWVTPFSFIAVIVIQKLLAISTVGNILKYSVLAFGGYFLAYGCILLPLQSTIEFNPIRAMDAFGDGKVAMRGLQSLLPLVLTISSWTSSLLYLTSELWGNIILSLLFMSYSNDICSFKQSIRFVPLFYIFSNVGLFCSGIIMYGFAYTYENARYSINRFVINAIFVMGGFLCFIIYMIQRNLENTILTKPICIASDTQQKRSKKVKLSFSEGLLYMLKSKLLFQICFIVLAYNICTNLIDQTFKAAIKANADAKTQNVGSKAMYAQATNQIVIAVCVIGILSTPFSRCIQIFGWTTVGFFTPVWALITTVLVLFLSTYNTSINGTNFFGFLNSMFHGKELYVGLEEKMGALSSAGLKIFKYAFFDLAKEAISMRIARTYRASFKSVYDGICGKLGKGLGSGIVILLNGATNSMDIRNSAPICMLMMLAFIVPWIISVKILGRKYNESVRKNIDMDLS